MLLRTGSKGICRQGSAARTSPMGMSGRDAWRRSVTSTGASGWSRRTPVRLRPWRVRGLRATACTMPASSVKRCTMRFDSPWRVVWSTKAWVVRSMGRGFCAAAPGGAGAGLAGSGAAASAEKRLHFRGKALHLFGKSAAAFFRARRRFRAGVLPPDCPCKGRNSPLSGRLRREKLIFFEEKQPQKFGG